MRRPSQAFPLFAVLALVACEKAAPPPPEPEPEPPAALLGYGELPSATDLSALTDAVSQIAPEAGPMVATALPMQLGQAMGAHLSSTDAVDLAGPLRVLVLDPESHPQPLVFVVRAKGSLEAKKGSQVVSLGDFAAFGAPEAVVAVDGYAAHLATQPVADARIVAFPGNALAAFRDELDNLPELAAVAPPAETGGMDFGAILEIYIEIIEAIAADSELATLTVTSEEGVASFHLEIRARADSELAAFYAAQKPAPLTAHQRLPAFERTMFFGDWELHAGPLMPAMMRYSDRLVAAAMPDRAEGVQQWLRKHSDLLTGDGAMAMSMDIPEQAAMPAVRVVAAYGVRDASDGWAALLEGMALWSGKQAMFGVEAESRFEAQVATHAGVPIARQESVTTTPNPMTGAPARIEQVAHFAAAGNSLVYALGDDSEALVRGTIDVAAGEAPHVSPDARLARALELARAAKASALMYMDMSGVVPAAAGPAPTFAMTLGFSERAMTLTMSFLR